MNDEILARLFDWTAGDVPGRVCGREDDSRMSQKCRIMQLADGTRIPIRAQPDKCPGCVTPCEECDKPLSVVEYQANFPLAPWGYLEQLEKRIAQLERTIEERTGD